MFQVHLGLLSAFIFGAAVAYPSRYSQPTYHQQYPPSQQVQYQRAPVVYQTAPVYSHQPVQYQHLQQPQYQSVPVAYSSIDPISHHESAAQTQSAHGQQAAGHSTSGHTSHADKAISKESAASAHGQHNTGGTSAHGTHGGHQNYHGTYQDVGSYSEDKGSGFEKSYSYDTASGFHDITAEDAGNSNSHGSQTKEVKHNTGAHSIQNQEKTGAHSKAGSTEHSSQAHNKSLFEKYGYTNSGKKVGYSYSPVYGYGYH